MPAGLAARIASISCALSWVDMSSAAASRLIAALDAEDCAAIALAITGSILLLIEFTPML